MRESDHLFPLPAIEKVASFKVYLQADKDHLVPFYLQEPKTAEAVPAPFGYIDETATLIVFGKFEDIFSEKQRRKDCVYAMITGLKGEKLTAYNGSCFFFDKGHVVRKLPKKEKEEQLKFQI